MYINVCISLIYCLISGTARGGSRIEFLGGTDDVGGVISGCGQLRLPDLFLRSQNFEG